MITKCAECYRFLSQFRWVETAFEKAMWKSRWIEHNKAVHPRPKKEKK